MKELIILGWIEAGIGLVIISFKLTRAFLNWLF